MRVEHPDEAGLDRAEGGNYVIRHTVKRVGQRREILAVHQVVYRRLKVCGIPKNASSQLPAIAAHLTPAFLESPRITGAVSAPSTSFAMPATSPRPIRHASHYRGDAQTGGLRGRGDEDRSSSGNTDSSNATPILFGMSPIAN